MKEKRILKNGEKSTLTGCENENLVELTKEELDSIKLTEKEIDEALSRGRAEAEAFEKLYKGQCNGRILVFARY